MKWIAMMAGLLLATTAEASCPWQGDIRSVNATMTTVTINGQVFPVKGATARAQFLATLTECGVDGAAMSAFSDWREMRRWTNITAGVGIACCLWPVLIVTPFTAIEAGLRRDRLIVALTNG